MNNDKALYSGFISGIVHTLVGYPFDTLKTLKQSKLKVKEVNLFKGVSYPLIQSGIMNSIMFGSNSFLKKNNNEYLSNFYTGIISAVICTPLDKYKITKQYNLNYNLNIKNILKSYKNIHIVSSREIPAVFLYFTTYQELKKKKYQHL